MKTIVQFLFVLLLTGFISCASRTQISHADLVELLEIRQWEVPMPKDKRYQWVFEIRDYEDYMPLEKGNDDWMDRSRKARITFMPTDDENIYRFWFQQSNTLSNGRTRIDVCDDPDDIKIECEADQIEVLWHDRPIRIGDGKTYLIGELEEIFVLQRKKQIVLYLFNYKLEDM